MLHKIALTFLLIPDHYFHKFYKPLADQMFDVLKNSTIKMYFNQ